MCKAWKQDKDVIEPEQMILDLRSVLNKELDQQNKNTRTFKSECDLWNDRPELVWAETVQVTEWRSSVHYLPRTDQILHLVPDEKGTRI